MRRVPVRLLCEHCGSGIICIALACSVIPAVVRLVPAKGSVIERWQSSNRKYWPIISVNNYFSMNYLLSRILKNLTAFIGLMDGG